MKKRTILLYEWVNENNPPPQKQFDKGWWETIEFYYHLDGIFPDCRPSVIGTYVIQTPPPCEELILPTVKLQLPAAVVVLQSDFAPMQPFWTLAVKRQARSQIKTFGLFDPAAAVPNFNLGRLPKAWRFRPLAKDKNKFCCQLGDEFHVFTFLWILGH